MFFGEYRTFSVCFFLSNFQRLFVYGLYQLQNIAFICSIYQTIVLAFQRYLAVKSPIEYYMDNSVAAIGKQLHTIYLFTFVYSALKIYR